MRKQHNHINKDTDWTRKCVCLLCLTIASLFFFSPISADELSAEIPTNEITLEDLATPDTGEEWFLVGNLFFDAMEYNDAIGSWHNAMILDPSFASDSWYNIGLAYAHTQMYEDAILAWMKSIEYNPSFAASYDNIATAYLILGMPKEAFMAYDAAITIAPGEEKYIEDRTFLIQSLQDVAQEADENAFPIEQWNDIGLILYHEGNIASAQEAWQKAVTPTEVYTEEPTILAKIWKNLAIADMEQRNYASAMNAWLHSLEIYPDGSAYNDLGYCYIMLDMPKEALSAFENALIQEPDNELFLNNKNNLLALFPEIKDEEGE